MNHKIQFKKLCFIIFSFILFSCENDNISNQNIEKQETEQNNLIYFKGLPVNHRFSTPISELETEHNEQVLINYYNEERSIMKKKSGLAAKSLALEMPDNNNFINGVIDIQDQFPYDFEISNTRQKEIDDLILELSYQNSLPEEIKEIFLKRGIIQEVDEILMKIELLEEAELERKEKKKWEIIKKDFPTLNESQIEENKDLIDLYYSQNFDFEVMKKIADNDSDEIKYESKKIVKAQKAIDSKAYIDDVFQPACALAKSVGNGFSYTLSLASLILASDRSKTSSRNFFGSKYGSGDSREDAYRHALWNALLAQHYVSLSSIKRRLRFAKTIADARETCASNNPIDSEAMDYHNNQVGRDVWGSMTGHRKFLGATIGLKLPSISSLKRVIADKVNNACYVVKNKMDRFPENKLVRNRERGEVRALINNVDKYTAVFFKGEIGPSKRVKISDNCIIPIPEDLPIQHDIFAPFLVRSNNLSTFPNNEKSTDIDLFPTGLPCYKYITACYF